MIFFFFSDAPTTEIYTLSLHDALPISEVPREADGVEDPGIGRGLATQEAEDRKSTRLNSSHSQTSYAVFCLKKKTSHRRSAPPPPPRAVHRRKRLPPPSAASC